MSAAKRYLPHLVALWFVVHVASTCVSAIPDPRFAMKKDLWKDARVQSEMDRWARTFGVDEQRFEDGLWRFGTWASDAHAALDAPFAPYFLLSGNKQRWPMFGAGSPEADCFEVRARRCREEDEVACPWETLYGTGSSEARMLADVLEAPRVRSLVSASSYRGFGAARTRLCRAVAHDVLGARDDLAEVECSYLRQIGVAPRDDAPAPPVPRRERAVRVTRAELMKTQEASP